MADDSNIVFILIAIIAVLVCKELYDLYTKFTKSKHEVYFVMATDPPCCNPYEDPGSSNNCKKYCPGKLLMELMNRINWAKSSMCIAMYNFSNHRLADCILRAHRRGVKIRLIIDKTASETNENKAQARRLKNAGIPVRVAGEQERLMHNKLCLIDGTAARGVLITGSMNWTYGGLSKNCENIAFIDNHHMKYKYLQAFDHMWNKHASQYYSLPDSDR